MDTVTNALKPINDFKVGINPDIKLEGAGISALKLNQDSLLKEIQKSKHILGKYCPFIK